MRILPLLSTATALLASLLLGTSAWGDSGDVLLATRSPSARERVSLDAGWRFRQGDPADVTPQVKDYPEISVLHKLVPSQVTGPKSESFLATQRPDIIATRVGENVSVVQPKFDAASWRPVDLPHDWALELPFDPGADYDHGFKALGDPKFGANNIGWYRRTFTVPSADAGKKFQLEFDGVYRNCLVWLNGHILGRNVSGYASFYFDATPYLKPGEENVLVVRVDASRFEGWFYEGAGIYRHVWLTKTNPVHVAQWGTFVYTSALSGNAATVTIETEVVNGADVAANHCTLVSTIYDAEGKEVVATFSPLNIPVGQTVTLKQQVSFKANLWSPKTPYLYKLVSKIGNQTAASDLYTTPFGVRTVKIDAAKGVLINGEPVEILGMCNHQDHAGVGLALPDRLQYFRIERLLSIGANAYRTSHNTPTAELLDACDRLGMLVMDENRRFGSDAETLGQLSRHIRRDRNHPSVFIWSLANEEKDLQGKPVGAEVAKAMQDLAHSLDSTRLCTVAMNHDWGKGISTVIDVQGYNYRLGDMDKFHAAFPNQPSIGTETASLVSDRGIYADDPKNGFMGAYDVKKPKLGWGSPAQEWWPHFNARPWASGGFAWTGFDYRGEPSPYYKNFVNTGSHFGTLDQCGFMKDIAYYYQANWSLKPTLHIFPHWNWETPGQNINVWVFGNCRAVELFVNGASVGRKPLNPRAHVEWIVPYAPGSLKAVGYDASGAVVLTETIETAGQPAGIRLTPDRATILADGRDVSVITVAVVDAQGRVVPTSSNEIQFSIKGGAIIGVGNGNPSSHEEDKASKRQVFNGLAQVIVQSFARPGPITLTATSPGLKSVDLPLVASATPVPPAAPVNVSAFAGDAQVTVSWDIVPGAVTYNILRAQSPGKSYVPIARRVSGVNLGYVDRAVTNGTTYSYAVVANGTGASPRSAEVSATLSPHDSQ